MGLSGLCSLVSGAKTFVLRVLGHWLLGLGVWSSKFRDGGLKFELQVGGNHLLLFSVYGIIYLCDAI